MVQFNGHTVVCCSWCHTGNRVQAGEKAYCWNCWHRADVARVDCDCSWCEAGRLERAGVDLAEACRSSRGEEA